MAWAAVRGAVHLDEILTRPLGYSQDLAVEPLAPRRVDRLPHRDVCWDAVAPAVLVGVAAGVDALHGELLDGLRHGLLALDVDVHASLVDRLVEESRRLLAHVVHDGVQIRLSGLVGLL